MKPTLADLNRLLDEAQKFSARPLPETMVLTIFFDKLKKAFPDYWSTVLHVTGTAVRHKKKQPSRKGYGMQYQHWVEFKALPKFKQAVLFDNRPTAQDIKRLAVFAGIDD